jgi:hypothetical protein
MGVSCVGGDGCEDVEDGDDDSEDEFGRCRLSGRGLSPSSMSCMTGRSMAVTATPVTRRVLESDL